MDTPQDVTRREFSRQSLAALLTMTLLETLGEADVFADSVKPVTKQWLTKVNELARDVKNQKLRQVE